MLSTGTGLITGKTKSRCKHFPVRSGASSMTRMLFVSLFFTARMLVSNKESGMLSTGAGLITGKTKSRCKHLPVRSGASSMTRMLFVSLPVICLLLWHDENRGYSISSHRSQDVK